MTYELLSEEERILSLTPEQAEAELEHVTQEGIEAPRLASELVLDEEVRRQAGW